MRFIYFFVSVSLLALPSAAFAANLSVYPPSIELKTGDSVEFRIRLQSQNSINTVGTSVLLPAGLTFLLATDGPVITQWVEHPTFDKAARAVSFSGIIQNGWRGDGMLATVKVAALSDGMYALGFDPAQTEIYRNDGKATPEPVIFSAADNTGRNILLSLGLIVLLLVIIRFIFKRRYKVTFV